jgi:hypothetical protein
MRVRAIEVRNSLIEVEKRVVAPVRAVRTLRVAKAECNVAARAHPATNGTNSVPIARCNSVQVAATSRIRAVASTAVKVQEVSSGLVTQLFSLSPNKFEFVLIEHAADI